MTGTEKLPLLAIGKDRRPRCCKWMDLNRLPTEYTHQHQAWMDGAIFSSWVKKLDHKMVIQKRSDH